MQILDVPVYPVGYDFIDDDCRELGEYLANEVNQTFADALGGNAIKTFKPFNDVFIPITDFPVLKVYKSKEVSLDFLSNIANTEFTISYSLAYTQSAKTADVGVIVAKELTRLLKVYSYRNGLQLDHDTPITVQYDELIDTENTVYTYATIKCNFLTIPRDAYPCT
jgi:hypothetical protein